MEDKGDKRYFQKGSLFYEVHGQGKPILLLHGYGISPPSFKPLIDVLAKEYLVIAPCLSLGWRKKGTAYCFDELVDVLKEMIEEKHIKPVIVGCSMGNVVAIKFALKYREMVERLVIVDGFDGLSNRLRIIFGVAYEVLVNLFSFRSFNIFYKTCLDFLENLFLHPVVLFSEMKECFSTDIVEASRGLDVKTLILWGEREVAFPLSVLQKLKSKISDSTLEVIEKGGHFWFLIYPGILLSKLNRFLNEQ
jgi:pimeloyl-ACP methyl ester carboxylesterase